MTMLASIFYPDHPSNNNINIWIESIAAKSLSVTMFFQCIMICTQDAPYTKVNYTCKFCASIKITLGCD